MRIPNVLITGANRGIGLEFVKQFLNLPSPPNIIFATCRNPDKADDLQNLAKSNPNVKILPLEAISASRNMLEMKRQNMPPIRYEAFSVAKLMSQSLGLGEPIQHREEEFIKYSSYLITTQQLSDAWEEETNILPIELGSALGCKSCSPLAQGEMCNASFSSKNDLSDDRRTFFAVTDITVSPYRCFVSCDAVSHHTCCDKHFRMITAHIDYS
ncbi:hypothetical protein AVEN_187119-1 [Araneus ventricosus]|uniref:Ketoreductase (KR) domain-containing protein n=1 Tax=Araneus ventricosus TaxID=182803 RepID=A0A4Y2EVP0_ARAVE|nr:hypothetical protein AVEN_187119-1 [Araneus ventricosus]